MKKEIFETAQIDLIEQISKLGFKIIYEKKDHKRGGGSMDEANKVVTVYYPSTRKRRIFVLAHELRHVQHSKEGLYPSYYNPEVCTYSSYLWEIRSAVDANVFRPVLPNLGVALRAENNCNRFAERYLKSIGIEHKAPKYPKEKTLTYRIWKLEYLCGLRESV